MVKSKLIRFSALLFICSALALSNSSKSFSTNENEHWAANTLIEFHEMGLYKALKVNSKSFNQTLSYNDFERMFIELLSIHQTELKITEATPKTITRQGAAEVLYKTLGEKLKTTETPDLITATDWAKHYKILTLDSKGNLNPQKNLTVGEGVAIMKKIHTLLGEAEKRAIEDALTGNTSLSDIKQRQDVTYQISQSDEDTTKFILSWGKKSTGGYSIRIQRFDVQENKLLVYYKLSSPRPGAMTTQVISYPKDEKTIQLPIEIVKTLNIILIEDNQ